MKNYFRFCSFLIVMLCFCSASNAQTFKRTQSSNTGGKIAPQETITATQLSNHLVSNDLNSHSWKNLVSYDVLNSSGIIVDSKMNQAITSNDLTQLIMNFRMKGYTLRFN